MTTPKKRIPLNVGLIVIGSELAAMTIFGVILDVVTETKGLFTVCFTLFGMMSAVLMSWLLLRQEKQEQDKPS
jgi:F0F1-type ATP synthase assembly protein I